MVQNVDFSLFDTIVGVAGGAIACIIVFVLLGYVLVKYGVVHFGAVKVEATPANHISPEFCSQCKAEQERSKDNKDKIEDLYHKYGEHDRLVTTLLAEMGAVKAGVQEILTQVRGK